MEFDWHDCKSAKNLRGFGFDFAALIFEGRTIEWVDDRRDYGETRIRALGEAEGLVLHVVYTMRGEICWIISARLASRKERQLWFEGR